MAHELAIQELNDAIDRLSEERHETQQYLDKAEAEAKMYRERLQANQTKIEALHAAIEALR